MKTSGFYLLSAVCAAFVGAHADVYLSTTGIDAIADGSQGSPYRTLPAAVNALGVDGGTVYVENGTYTLEEAVSDEFVVLNVPVKVVGVSGHASDVVFKRGTAKGRLFTLNHADAELRNVTVQGGQSDVLCEGGNVHIGSQGGTVANCILKDGRCTPWGDAKKGGGNLYMKGGRCVNTVLTGGSLGNIRNWGAAAYLDNTAVMENCLVYGNRDTTHSGNYSGGTIRLDGSSKVINCTIVKNAQSRHAGLWFGSANARAINCVIYGNTIVNEEDTTGSATDVCPNACFNANASNAYAGCLVNCASDADARFMVPNETMLTVTASDFVDAANGDWHLSNASVCRNAGADFAEAGGVTTTDLDGAPRVAGDVDIGCYEKEAVFYVAAEASAMSGQLPENATITFTVSSYYAPSTVTYAWNFGDGTTLETTETSVSHAYTESGTYSVSVVAVSGTQESTFEFTDPIAIFALECTFEASASPVMLGSAYTFSVVDVHSPETVTYTWDFGDGATAETTADSVDHVYEAVGSYSVSVVASTANSGSISYAFPEVFGVVGRDLYVRETGGSNEYPYDTYAKATSKPQTALDAAVDGCVIHVYPGTYDQRKGVGETRVTKAVTLIGEGATPEETVLLGYRQNNGSRNLLVSNEGALVANLVLDGGFSGAAPGGGNLCLSAGTVSNCVLRGGRTRNNGAVSGGARVQGGLLTHCVITNSFHGNRGDGIIMNQSGGRVSNCLLGYNKLEWDTTRNASHLVYVSGGSIENCTIVGGRILKYDPERPMQMKNTSDKGVHVGANARATNVVIADVKYTSYDAEKVAEFEAVPVSDWVGTAASFINCATDDEVPINETCRVGTVATFFEDYATGNLIPKHGGPLLDRGFRLETLPSIDLAGNPRLFGNAIDIGCYENPVALATILFFR